MPLDVDRLADAVLDGTRALIAKATAPLVEANEELRQANADLCAANDALAQRLAAVEGREPEKGEPGKDADPAELNEIRIRLTAVEQALAEEPLDLTGFATVDEVRALAAKVDELPEPKDYDEAIETIRGEIAEVAKSIPEPQEPPDLSGYAEKSAVEALSERVAAIPEPKDHGPEIAEVRALVDAIQLPDVIHGKDGAGFVEAKQNDDGELILKLATGETFNVGKVRGDDGLGFEDMAFEYDGERTIALTFTKGGRVERQEIVVPLVLDQGTWKERTYQAGDGVTCDGSFWIAQTETDGKPGQSKDWRLAVKKGRNGKDGVYKMAPEGPVKIR